MSFGLVGLNVSQAAVISLALGLTLSICNYFIENGKLTTGGFVMFNTYNMQIYMPLGFLGTMWRFVRQSMVDIE